MNESTDTNTSFSLDEIRRQLAALGYENVDQERLEQFQSDLSRLMSRSGGGDSTLNSECELKFALDLSDAAIDDSTIQEPSDATSYNPLPNVKVPRQPYIPDDFEKSLDALDGFTLAEPVVKTVYTDDDDDSASILTEDLINLPTTRKMQRKVARHAMDGSFVTECTSVMSNHSLVTLTHDDEDEFDTESTMSELDDELKARLDKLKMNLGIGQEKQRNQQHRRPLTAVNTRLETKVRFIDNDDQRSVSTLRPKTAPPRCVNTNQQPPPSFLRPDLSVKAKSSPVELYQQYKQTWDKHKQPDGVHNRVRRDIRAMCAERENQAVRPGRKITTDYVVPTTKKRQALMWEVRTALHNRQVINK